MDRRRSRSSAVLEKNELKPHLREQWCIPPESNADFVCHLETCSMSTIDLTTRKRPVVCLDEADKQLVGEVIRPIPVEPGQPERFDCEYTRHGTANLFMISEPLTGWRAVKVTERRNRRGLRRGGALAGRGGV